MTNSTPKRLRPLSPNIQIYRPQLTSVLSIANRLSGIVLSLYTIVLVVWLVAAATGPQAYSNVHIFMGSGVGRILLFGCTFSFFLHLCGSIRHLIWDAGFGFELRTIYASGWMVVLVSSALTIIAWIVSIVLTGWNR
jgi:succinate dehydrogenase / fumarate reductase cytochrome b subunit